MQLYIMTGYTGGLLVWEQITMCTDLFFSFGPELIHSKLTEQRNYD